MVAPSPTQGPTGIAQPPEPYRVSVTHTAYLTPDGRGERPRSFSLVETWGSAEVDGVRVDFVRALSGLQFEYRFDLDGRRHNYRLDIRDLLQATLEAAVSDARAEGCS